MHELPTRSDASDKVLSSSAVVGHGLEPIVQNIRHIDLQAIQKENRLPQGVYLVVLHIGDDGKVIGYIKFS